MNMKSKLLIILSLLCFGQSYAQYCAAGPSSAFDSNVQSVSLNGATMNINHTGCPGITGAQDLTAQIADVLTNASYTVGVQFGTCGGNYSGAGEVWIDWNSDNTFQPTESLGTWTGTPPTVLSSFSFIVPATALPGVTRMRVMQIESGSIPLDPCGTYSWGSVMDFGINIVSGTPITCPSPSALSVANVTATTADISWTTGGSPVSYVEYGPTGFTPGTTSADSAFLTSSNSLTITGISSATNYDFYVRDFCALGDSSFNIGPVSFLTTGTCGTFVLELYDSYGDGWNGGMIDVYVNGLLQYPGLTILTGNGPITFSIPLNIGDLVSIDYTSGSYSTENEYTLYDENGNVAVFEGGAGTTPNNFGPQEACSTCSEPSSLSSTAATVNSVSLAWTTGGATTWLVEYGSPGFSPGNGDSIFLVTGTSAIVSGLSAATNYDFYVQDFCGLGDTSTSEGPLNLSTAGTCGTYELQLIDSYGDGWNGGIIDVYVNGLLQYPGLTILTGPGPVTFSIPLNIGDLVSLDYTSGSFASENEYTLYDENGSVIVFEGGANSTPNDFGPQEACQTCPNPSALGVTAITSNSAIVNWTTGGASVWLLEYGPAGFTPGTGTLVASTTFNLTGLTPSTLYDVYVADFCFVDDTSNFVAITFGTDCDTILAPYYQTFDFALTDPHCWSSAGVEPWLYRNSLAVGTPSPSYGVQNSIDHTSGIGNFAWIDASGGINTNELNSPVIDYSGLTQGIVGCWVKSNNIDNDIKNQIQIEGWNGLTWDSIINYSGNFDGWRRVYANIPASLPTTTIFRIVQIEDLVNSGNAFNNDLLIDDFFVEEAPTCYNPTNLMDSIISPTLVELSWISGGATNWIIEYGPIGFSPGTGTGTLVNTNQNPYVLPINSGQDYDWYVQDSCGPTDISWHSYVESFSMPGEVICGDTVINFTYCHPDESVELFTYQSDNSTSFLHLVFNAGILGNSVDFTIYDGPNDTYPVLFSSTGGTNMATMEFVTSGPFVAFSYNSVFANGCTTPLDFDINCCEITTFEQVVNICVDSTYTLPDGIIVDTEAVYYTTIPNTKGCDSLIATVINILEDSTTVTDIICSGSSYLLPDGTTTFAPGNYQMVVSNYLGCDSAIDITLTLGQPSSSSRNVAICDGETYQLPNGTFVSTAGVYDLSYTNADGCDSTYSVDLTLLSLTTDSENKLICQGDSYTLYDGIVVNTSGVYTSQTLNLNGCTHTITTTLTVATSSFASDTIEICGNETYTLLNGDVVDEAGEYNVNVANVFDCDSIVTVYVSKCIASGITGEEGNAVASIFPNPSNSFINVSFNTEVVNNKLDVKVMNALGQEIALFENILETSLIINVSNYSNGMYYLVVNDNLNTSIRKFIVSK